MSYVWTLVDVMWILFLYYTNVQQPEMEMKHLKNVHSLKNMQVDTHIWHIIPSVLRRNINLETAPKLSLSFWNSNLVSKETEQIF